MDSRNLAKARGVEDVRDSHAICILKVLGGVVQIDRKLSLGEFGDWLDHINNIERSDRKRGIERPKVLALRKALVAKFIKDIGAIARGGGCESEMIRMWKKCVPNLLDFCSRGKSPLSRRSPEIRKMIRPVICGVCSGGQETLLFEIAKFLYPNYVAKEAKTYVRRVSRLARSRRRLSNSKLTQIRA